MGDFRLQHVQRPGGFALPDPARGGCEDLSIVTHVGRPDETVHELGEHELLVIVQGPHGYISSSWYGDHIEVPTWNFIAAHLSGVPEILQPDENFEVLTRLVDHFERHVTTRAPWTPLRRLRPMPAGTAGARWDCAWCLRGSSPSGR